MKTSLRTFAILALFSVAAACGGPSPAGTYELDVDSLMKSMPMPMMPGGEGAEEVNKMMEQLKKSFSGTIELEADKTVRFVMKMPPMMNVDESGKWTIAGDQVTITPDKEGEEAKTFTLKDGVLSATEEKGGQKVTMTFRKQTKS